jgi:multidrug resistance efflux pump
MNTKNKSAAIVTVLVLGLSLSPLLVGCERKPPEAASSSANKDAVGQPVTNRVDIPSSVRQNLGITFAGVESRSVARMLRLPGRFELVPTARREYRAQVGGRVELLVSQFARVEAGAPLYRIDSPRWREMQKELADAHAGVSLAQAAAESMRPLLEAHENHHKEIQHAVDLWTTRVSTLDQLQRAGGARGDEVAQAKASLASARSDLAETLEKEAQLGAREKETAAALDAARSRLVFLYESASALAGVSVAELQRADVGSAGGQARPRWATLGMLEVRALAPGIVESVSTVSGGVVQEHGEIVTVVQPEQVRFRAVGLQSDLPRLTDGQSASVVAAQDGSAKGAQAAISGRLTLGPTADADRRTVDVIFTPVADSGGSAAPAWARAGVSAFLEVVTGGSGSDELAIPLRCVARDGTQAIIFRRDPANPDKAIRMEADLGLDDGRWIVVKSGVAEGNEIVLEGVYQLMVATSGSIIKGGHFHPDGTFHEGED